MKKYAFVGMGDSAVTETIMKLTPAEEIEKKQLELIEQLMSFIDRLNKSFAKNTTSATGKRPVAKENLKSTSRQKLCKTDLTKQPFSYNLVKVYNFSFVRRFTFLLCHEELLWRKY